MLHVLDLRTLVFAHGVLLLSASVGFVIATRYLQRFSALPYWSLSSMLMGVGSILLAARGYVSAESSILLANLLMSLAITIKVKALSRDFEHPVPFLPLCLALVVSMGGMLWGFYVEHSTSVRFAFGAGVNGALLLWGAWIAWCYLRRSDSLRVVVGILIPLVVQGLCGVIAGATGLADYLSGRIVVEAYPGAAIYEFSMVHFSMGMLAILSSLGLYFSVILFVAMRLNVALTQQAHHDALTGLYNRHMFYELVERELAMDLRRGVTSSLLFIDIDHFKCINDSYGHAAGDHMLRQFAAFLCQQCRQSDVIARFGGEEFCVLMPTIDAEGARQAAERLCQEVRQLEILWEGRCLPLTLSIGVTERCNFSEGIDTLIHRADLAMYEAKQSGRNRVVLNAA
ncbi:GGDEF domain-containing protein [Uliginosibacterium gangwonense]|uniref:GGDEF domain-containing protein n=1 Tax=Uliginosibacterium gangwonense TaxID=392736 RepID=UPI000380038C|nr:GGDEF domain-containing protein [Uliginosibacterium gangwonense]